MTRLLEEKVNSTHCTGVLGVDVSCQRLNLLYFLVIFDLRGSLGFACWAHDVYTKGLQWHLDDISGALGFVMLAIMAMLTIFSRG